MECLMYRMEEIEVKSISAGLEKVRENIGKWAEVNLTKDNRVQLSATHKKNIMGVKFSKKDIVGYLPDGISETVLEGIKSGKKIKARIFDFVPKFEEALPTYNVSIWMN